MTASCIMGLLTKIPSEIIMGLLTTKLKCCFKMRLRDQPGSTTGPVTSLAASGQEEMGEEKFLLGEPLSFYLFHLTSFYILNF